MEGPSSVERVAADRDVAERSQTPAPAPSFVTADPTSRLVVGSVDDAAETEADSVADNIVDAVRRSTWNHGSDNIDTASSKVTLAAGARNVARSSVTGNADTASSKVMLAAGAWNVARSSVTGVAPTAMGRGRAPQRIRRSATRSAAAIGPEGGEVDAETSSRIMRSNVGGESLAGGLRDRIEGAVGADLGAVRIHRNSDIAPKISARAFTVGNDIHFAPGEYAPTSRDGLRLLGHEVAHTLQHGAVARRTTVRRHYVRLPNTLGQEPLKSEAKKWQLADVVDMDMDKKIRRAVVGQVPEAMPEVRERVAKVRVAGVSPTDADWQEVISAGEQVPAKAREAHVFLNLTHRDYLRPDGEVDQAKVTSTVVHEMFHAISYKGHGLQHNFADLVSNGKKIENSPDEAVTDLLAYRAYRAAFDDDYRTAYFFRHKSGGAQAVPSVDVKKVQEANDLPVAWTSEMIDVICQVTRAAESKIIQMYLTRPSDFEALVSPKIKDIRVAWAKHLRQNAATQGFVHSKDDMVKIVYDVMEPHAAEFCAISKGEVGKATEAEQTFIRQKLAAANVPMQQDAASPGVPLFDQVFLSRILRPDLARGVDPNKWQPGNEDLKLLDADIDNDQRARDHRGLRKFLAKAAGLDTQPPGAARTGNGPPPPPPPPGNGAPPPPPPPGNGAPPPPPPPGGMGPVPAGPGPVPAAGHVAQAAKALPNPGGYSSPLVAAQVVQAAEMLGIPEDDIKHRLTVIAVAREVWDPGTDGPRKIALGTPFRDYPDGFIYGTPDPGKSLGDHLGVPQGERNDSAHAKIESYGGGGYEKNGELVLVAADRLGSIRTLLHEIGHWKQDVYDKGEAWLSDGSFQPVQGFSETNVHNIVLEYHNVVLHENRDNTTLRTSYRSVPSEMPDHLRLDDWPVWGTLLDDVRDHPGTEAALHQIRNALRTDEYSGVVSQIRRNLVREFYSDRQIMDPKWAVKSMPTSKFADADAL